MKLPFVSVFVFALFSIAASAQTLNKCTSANGKVTFQDGPCIETLQKQAEEEHNKREQGRSSREQAKKRQSEIEKKWEALDEVRMKSANPYGATVIPTDDRVLRAASQCGAIVGRAISCNLDVRGVGSVCGERIRFYSNFDKQKEKEGLLQFATTTEMARQLQNREPQPCLDVRKQLDGLK